MPPHFLRALLALTFIAILAPLKAQTNAPSTNAPATTPPPVPIALGDVVTQAQAASAQLQQEQTGLNPDTVAQSVEKDLPDWTSQIDDRILGDAPLLEPGAGVSLTTLQNSRSMWHTLFTGLESAQKDLSNRVHELDALLYQLSQMQKTWQATATAAQAAKAPAETLQRIREILTLIDTTTKAVRADQTQLYALQNRVAAQDARVKVGADRMTKAIEAARIQLFERDHPALWQPEAIFSADGSIVMRERDSLAAQVYALQDYLQAKIGAVLIHLLVMALLLIGFYWVRSVTREQAGQEAAFRHAAHVFDIPFVNALLLGLVATIWLYPAAPRLMLAVAGAVALIPAIILIRRLIEPALFPLLYATVIAYFIDQVRHVAVPAGIPARVLLIVELMAAAIFILIAFRSKRLCADGPNSARLERIVRAYLHFAFFVFLFAGFANAFGYVPLSIVAANGIFWSSYLAVICYAFVRIVDALAISAMSIRPFSALGMVRRHHDQIYGNVGTTIRWLAFALWFVAALQAFTVRDLLWQQLKAAMDSHFSWFHITFTVGAILAFPITVWSAFLISRFVRFILQEEIYPHLNLARGIPYAASTMVHYSVLLLGFLAAVAATGTHLSQFSFLAGAFGVGLGFGLQNIMNNFVSGIILLFERPVKVGDVVQIDANTVGKVERIGIRASVILLTNGSEMIVPNGNLISNPVTNWTLSNCERVIEVPVTVTSKTDPQHILDILTNVAKAHPSVLKNPAPQGFLITFGATLSFRLRAWIDAEEDWMKVTSDLSLAINAALAKESIALG